MGGYINQSRRYIAWDVHRSQKLQKTCLMSFEFLKTNLVLDNRDKPLVKTNKVLF